MCILRFFRSLRDRRFAKRVAKEELAAIQKTDNPPPEFSDLVSVAGRPIIQDRETQEQGAVTGTYKVVGSLMQEAIDDKRKGRDAAKRITNAIGAPPEPKPRKRRL